MDCMLSQYKALLVTNHCSQRPAIDCDKTFSLVVKLASICIVPRIDVTHHWPIR